MSLADFAHTRGNQAGAFGHDTRCTTLAILIGQRHRIMRGVGDYDVGLGHIGHHAPARHGTLLLAYAPLELWIAFAFLGSCRTSSRDMRSFLSRLKSCHGASMATIRKSAPQ